MKTIIYLELLRVVRDRSFWFWSLIGVPVLLPATVVLFAFAIASLGVVEPKSVKPVVATTVSDGDLMNFLSEEDLSITHYKARESVIAALSKGDVSVGLIDVVSTPGRPLVATMLSKPGSEDIPVYQKVNEALEAFGAKRRQELVNSLDFNGPSFELLVSPITIKEERVPDRLAPGLAQTVSVMWFALLIFPYVMLSRHSASQIVTDRLSGYLAPVNAGVLPPWKWLICRWCSMTSLGAALLAYSVIVFGLYMRAYGVIADLFVAEGHINNLSEESARAASVYLVDVVRIWRDTSLLSLFSWLILALVQIASLCALMCWGSVNAASLPQARLFELLPFAVIALVPVLGMASLGTGITSASWVPGLNTVLSLEHVISGALPGKLFLACAGIAVISNMVVILIFLALATLGLGNEKLWSV